jgi:hypothetical protein
MFNGHSNLVLSVFNLYLYSYPKVVLCHDYSARRLVPLYKRQAAAPTSASGSGATSAP